ncbi:MAG: hypothetical protein AAF766_19770 [Cyanobacteria bacterium P01_D01_bin.14]
MVSFLHSPRAAAVAGLAWLTLMCATGQAMAQTNTSLIEQSGETSGTLRAAAELGTVEGTRLMQEAEQAISSEDYTTAADKLQAARESLNNASLRYQELASAFAGIDAEITSDLRDRALEAAQMRDQATYQQALVYRAQSNPTLAVPLLIEIVQSQGPTRDLGQRAYQQLFELGFVSRAYRSPISSTDSSAALRPLGQPDSPIGIGVSADLIEAAERDFANQNLDQAASNLQTAREQLNEVSGYYQTLVTVFNGVDTRVADEARSLALEAAQLRDTATYQQALVHRAQNRPELAVPLLVQILQSQNPTRELGQQAYQQLFEIGFVELPYPSSTVE